MGVILNPSFEDALGAEWITAGGGTGGIMGSGRSADWATEGTHCWKTTVVNLEDKQFPGGVPDDSGTLTLTQSNVNLSSVSEILVDIRFDITIQDLIHPESYFLAKIYISNGGAHTLLERYITQSNPIGTYLYIDESLDVSMYNGTYDLVLHNETFGKGKDGPIDVGHLDGVVMYDNLRGIGSAAASRHRFTGGMLHRAVH